MHMTYRTKIQDGQIVVPSRLRRLAGLAEGDPLDVTFEQGKLTVMTPGRGKSRSVAAQPKKTEKQRRDEFLQKLRGSAPEALKKIWAESVRKGTGKITLREINSEIAAHRREKRQKQVAITSPVR
jgi:AbrB family looped-hinge helix DNA binding protein